MKVSFKGNVVVKKHPVKKRAKKPAGTAVQQQIRRAVRLEMNKKMTEVRRELSRLRVGIRRDLRRELYSPRFSRFIRSAVSNEAAFREQVAGYLNQSVAVATTAGTVSGTLIRVGDNYMVIQESPTTQVIIPLRSAMSIRPL
jgi:hypothetical protein